MKALATFALAALLLGCNAAPIKPDIDLPERPVLPVVTAESLQCLSAEAYANLTRRQLLLRQYAEQLETVIQTLTSQEEPAWTRFGF